MSDTDGKKPLGLGGGARSGQVKQSFSHGRTHAVVVETKRKRVVVPKPGPGGSGSGGGSGREQPASHKAVAQTQKSPGRGFCSAFKLRMKNPLKNY